jgi:ribose transport system substrate-binding protein
MLQITVRRRRRATPAVLGIVAIMSLAMAACSSSGGSSAAATGSSTAQSTASSGGSAQVTAANTFISPYLSAPTKIGPTVPLTSKAPSGKTMVNLMCTTSPQCATINAGEAAAAKAIGWKLQTIPYDATNVATLISGMKTALRYHPVAVSLSGIPQALWQSEVPAYQAAGVPIIPQQTGPVTTSTTVPVNIGDDSSVVGKIVGNWFIANSGGKGKALVVDIPDFGYLKEITTSMVSTISTGCPGCSITHLDATISQQADNTIVPAVVSALQRDRSINYVLAADGVLIPGLSSAMSAAGITGVTVGGALATAENEQAILNGTETAFTTYNSSYIGWQTIDVVLRDMEKMTIPAFDGGVPTQLVTKATVGTPNDSATAPDNYPQQFEQLWGTG